MVYKMALNPNSDGGDSVSFKSSSFLIRYERKKREEKTDRNEL